jgi:hypothetical protein
MVDRGLISEFERSPEQPGGPDLVPHLGPAYGLPISAIIACCVSTNVTAKPAYLEFSQPPSTYR